MPEMDEQGPPDDLDERMVAAVTQGVERAIGATPNEIEPLSFARRKELLDVAVRLCEIVNAAGIAGRELCFLDSCCNAILQS